MWDDGKLSPGNSPRRLAKELHKRIEKGEVTPQALKAELAKLFARGELGDEAYKRRLDVWDLATDESFDQGPSGFLSSVSFSTLSRSVSREGMASLKSDIRSGRYKQLWKDRCRRWSTCSCCPFYEWCRILAICPCCKCLKRLDPNNRKSAGAVEQAISGQKLGRSSSVSFSSDEKYSRDGEFSDEDESGESESGEGSGSGYSSEDAASEQDTKRKKSLPGRQSR
jgi:hypothetical protein